MIMSIVRYSCRFCSDESRGYFCLHFRLEEIVLKQGRTLLELGRELQRQRLNRQDYLADTRSLEVESTAYGSTLHLALDGKTYGFGIGDLAHQQIAARLNIPSIVTSTLGLNKSRNAV